jgi:outer membrane protein OmpU
MPVRLDTVWGLSALAGACLLALPPAPARAATVQPGGALDLTLTGRIRTKAYGGDLQAARLDRTVSDGLDFASDARLEILARARHAATGIEYGGNLQVNADEAGGAVTTDEAWLFVRGGFGEVRFGDDDGPSDSDQIAGFLVAAGTGGIDGAIVDSIAVSVTLPTNSGDNTKVMYRSPTWGGLGVNVAYTPNIDGGGDQIAPVDVDQGDWWEGSLLYVGAIGGADVLASVVGGICDIKASDTDDSCHTLFGGASIGLFGFRLAGGYGTENIGGEQRDWFNAGLAYGLGPANVSATFGMVTDTDIVVNGNAVDRPRNLVLSADVTLMPGLALEGDVGFFDNDVTDGAAAGSVGDTDDSGVQAVVRLAAYF